MLFSIFKLTALVGVARVGVVWYGSTLFASTLTLFNNGAITAVKQTTDSDAFFAAL